jgi:hypothetical protein
MAPSYRIATLVLLVALSLFVTLSFHRHGRPLRGDNRIEWVIAFDSPKPWVTRVFGTLLVKGLHAATPQIVKDRVTANSLAAQLAARLLRNPDLLDDGLAIFGIYFFLTGAAYLLGYSALVGLLAHDLAGLPPAWRAVAAALSLITLPPFFIGGFGYIYDLPQLAFAAALVYLMARRWDFAYLAVFALACLNKETTVLFVPLYVYYNWRKESTWRLAAMTSAQLAIFAAIYVALQRIFSANGGVPIEHYWIDQFNFLVAPNSWPGVVSVLLMVFLLAVGLRGAHRLLRGVFVLAPPLALLFLYGGWPGEYRVLFEIWPLLIVAWTLGAYRLYEAAGRGSPRADA